MRESGNVWAVVLAAGDGARLGSLTTNDRGDVVPKQFCSLRGGHSLLAEALRRCEAVATSHHICVVVASRHRRWWRPLLAEIPTANVIVQPRNRGTANGILLPLLHIMARDPDARIALLPSDHYVRDEQVLAAALQAAVQSPGRKVDEITLLGIHPENADPDLGYIVPGSADESGIARVEQFVEKPHESWAHKLIEAGALWNAFILTGHVRAFRDLFVMRHSAIVASMQSAIARATNHVGDARAITEVYRQLPLIDFSRHVLPGATGLLRVMKVDSCGWSDIGTPARLLETLRGLPRDTRTDSVNSGIIPLNLSMQLEKGHDPAFADH
jgi:mannose-1-phosphate guanylyltransferase